MTKDATIAIFLVSLGMAAYATYTYMTVPAKRVVSCTNLYAAKATVENHFRKVCMNGWDGHLQMDSGDLVADCN